MRTGLLALTLATAMVTGLCGCNGGNEQVVTTDGKKVSFPTYKDRPALLNNEWFRMENVSARIEPPEARDLPGYLVLNFQMVLRSDQVRVVRIVDVTSDFQPLLVNDVTLQSMVGRKIYNTDRQIVSERTTPWLFESDVATRVFSITMIDRHDQVRTWYQGAEFDTAALREQAMPEVDSLDQLSLGASTQTGR